MAEVAGAATETARRVLLLRERTAANQLNARMTELGILREVTGNARKERFRYEPYVRLFTDEGDRQ